MNTVDGAERGGLRPAPPAPWSGPGRCLVDFYDQLSQAGVLVPGGSCPTVGISGLALGGGVGVVGRKYGLTCDAIESVQIVTADGRVLTCDAGPTRTSTGPVGAGEGGTSAWSPPSRSAPRPSPTSALFTLDWPWSAPPPMSSGRGSRGSTPGPTSCGRIASSSPPGAGSAQVRTAGMFVGTSATLGSLVDALVAAVGAQPHLPLRRARAVPPRHARRGRLREPGRGPVPSDDAEPGGDARAGRPRWRPRRTSRRIPGATGIDAFVRASPTSPRRCPGSAAGSSSTPRGGHQRREAGRHGLRPPQRRGRDPGQRGHRSRQRRWWPRGGRGWRISPRQSARLRRRLRVPELHRPHSRPTGRTPTTGPISPDWCRSRRRYDPDDVFHFAQSIPTPSGSWTATPPRREPGRRRPEPGRRPAELDGRGRGRRLCR